MNYDVIVLGTGPGGYVAAIRASQLGLKVAVVEKESLGGVCLNWGCIPTKALLKSAQVFEYINHANDYGITVGDVNADFSKIIKRSRDVADGMSKGISYLMKKNKIEVINGFGKVKPGNNYAQDLKTKFGEMAQKRIVAGYQLGWHLWEVVGNPQAPFTHIIVEPMMISQMEKERTREGWLEMRKEAIPSMTDSDWTTFMEDVRDKRDLVAEAMFITVDEVKKDESVQLPDNIGVVK